MKKTIFIVITLSFLLSLGAIIPAVSMAQSPDGQKIVTFGELDYKEEVLRGPYDARTYRFGIPANWELAAGAEIQLDIKTFFEYAAFVPSAPFSDELLSGGTIEVIFNDVSLQTISLETLGENSITIPITTSALVSTREDGRHDLDIILDSGLSCEATRQTQLVIRPSSRFVLPYQTTPLEPDLRLLPRPIYQRSFEPDSAVLVMPDDPSTDELQAALTVAAGFGRLTDNNLLLAVVTAAELTPDLKAENHLIFVGKAAAFADLTAIELPAPVSGATFNAPNANPEDGIVQIAVSPWNSAKVALVIGANSDAGIVKAAQAMSTGQLRVGLRNDLSLVDAVRPEAELTADAADRTLADLGYELEQLERIGTRTQEYLFTIPAGYGIDTGAYLNLAFNHSAILDYEQSTLTAFINDEPVGSFRFTDESTSVSYAQFPIPRDMVQSGVNRLTIQATMIPRIACVDHRLEGLWVVIRPESLLHLPLVPLLEAQTPIFDLSNYPEPFSLDPSLGKTAFVLPHTDPLAWRTAAQIAFDLGDRSGGALVAFKAVYGDDVPEDLKQNYNLLIVGRASTLPIIADLGNALPASFEAGQDVAAESDNQVIFNFPAGVNIGYLELINAPWNKNRAVFTVLGSTDQGVSWAGKALTTPKLRGKLAGEFVVVNDEQIVVVETGRVPEISPITGTPIPGDITPVTPEQPIQRPGWLFPAILVSGGLFLGVLVVMGGAWLKRR